MSSDWQEMLAQAAREHLGYQPTVPDTAPDTASYPVANPPLAPVDKGKQPLRVRIERKGRAGKVVTCVSGWRAGEGALQDLCRLLKTRCGVGGTVKDDEIILQGNLREATIRTLRESGYTDTK